MIAMRFLVLIGISLMPAAAAAEMVINETGSTLLYPVFQKWADAYAAAKPDVKLDIAGSNSGVGIRAAIDGSVQIGTSDAYLSDEEAVLNRQFISVPLAISAQTVNCNVPGLKDGVLKLDGPVLAAIYTGKIRQWDDAAIAALNPGVTLPHNQIIPVRRDDRSGDTFVFTQFLDFSTPAWDSNAGYGIEIEWPTVPGELGATGNDGMVKTLGATPYSIGYVGISFGNEAAMAGLIRALLKNQAGEFVTPTPENVTAAADELDRRTPADERLSLVYAPGPQSYPLVNYEYAIVSTKQPDANVAAAIRDFLRWSIAVDGGNASRFLEPAGFIPLPDFIRAMGEKQIKRIQ